MLNNLDIKETIKTHKDWEEKRVLNETYESMKVISPITQFLKEVLENDENTYSENNPDLGNDLYVDLYGKAKRNDVKNYRMHENLIAIGCQKFYKLYEEFFRNANYLRTSKLKRTAFKQEISKYTDEIKEQRLFRTKFIKSQRKYYVIHIKNLWKKIIPKEHFINTHQKLDEIKEEDDYETSEYETDSESETSN